MRSFPLAAVFLAALFGVHVAHARQVAAASSPAPSSPPAPSVIVKPLANGVTLTQEIDSNPPLIINVITADLNVPQVRIATAIGGDSITSGAGGPRGSGEPVEIMAQRHEAVAAVNGDYFTAGDPLGFGVNNGELYSEPWKVDRAAFGIEPDGKSVLFDVLAYIGMVTASDGAQWRLSAIDRPVSRGDAGDMVVYTQFYGPMSGGHAGCTEAVLTGVNLPLAPNRLMTGTVSAVTQNITAPSAIPDDGIVLSAPGLGPASDFLFEHLKTGDKVSFLTAIAPKASLRDAIRLASLPREDNGDLPSRAGGDFDRSVAAWSSVMQAIGGGPRLITDSKVTIDGVDEGFDASFTDSLNPRTSVGVTADDKLLLFAVDGRDKLSRGVTLPQLAAIMLRYGVVDGINLDGGGSTTMAANGLMVDLPSVPGEGRRVADMLVVYAHSDTTSPSKSATIIAPIDPVQEGETAQLTASCDGKDLQGNDNGIIWRGVVDGGVGFVSQDGMFHALAPGNGTITALVDGLKMTAPIMVKGSAPVPSTYALTADLAGIPGSPGKQRVSVRIADATGAAGAGIPVTISVHGGASDSAVAVTDEDGVAHFTVIWSGNAGSITVHSGSLADVTVYYTQTQPNNSQSATPTQTSLPTTGNATPTPAAAPNDITPTENTETKK